MKKTLLVVIYLFLLIALFPFLSVNANSAPIMHDEPGQHGLIPLVDNEIDIVKEELVFDFRNMTNVYGGPITKVTATYHMKNTKTETIKMAFPLLTDERGILNTSIITNSVDLTPTIYYGQSTDFNEFEQMTIDDIIDQLYDDDYDFEHNPYGFLYTFDFGMSSTIEIVLPRLNGQVIIQDGFTGYSQDNLNITLTASSSTTINKGKPSLFIANGDPDFPQQTYDKELMPLQEYLTLVSASTQYHSIQYNSLLSRLIDSAINSRFSVIRIQSILDEIHQYRLMVLVYDVPLLGDGVENVVSVTYEMQGRRYNRYNPPIYEYEYFLLPASVYRSFKDLTVKIYPNETEKYLIDSSMTFIEEDGYYISFSETLPEENLTFRISSSESPKRTSSSIINGIMIFFAIMIALLPAAVIVPIVIVIVVTRRKKRRL